MAIKANEITSDLTLELDEDEIAISDFGRAFDSFAGLVKEISKEACPGKSVNAWSVKVYPGSAGIGFSASGIEFAFDDVAKIQKIIFDGLGSLANGFRPVGFSDRALEYSRSLAKLFKSKKDNPSIRLWSNQEKSFSITRTIADKVDEMLTAAYEESGSVDGILEKVDGHHKSQFVIFDVMDERSIKCDVDDKLLATAVESFKRRVEVIGSVRYRKDGMPVSIRASKIIPFPSASEIPSLEQMRALLSGGQ